MAKQQTRAQPHSAGVTVNARAKAGMHVPRQGKKSVFAARTTWATYAGPAAAALRVYLYFSSAENRGKKTPEIRCFA